MIKRTTDPQRRRFLSRAGLAAGAALIHPALARAARLEKSLAPKPDLWRRWSAHDPDSTQSVDHAAWDRFLAVYLKPRTPGPNRVAYGDVSVADKAVLDAYLDGLSAVAVSKLGRAEQFAFWVNLYNALTVRTIIRHYPVASIRDIDISPGLLADGPWKAKLLRVEGEDLRLDDIEHRILRPIWKDPRIHYAVNCAAVGCPDLSGKAFTAANTEALLEAGARAFVNDPRGVRLAGKGLIASKIYLWFQVDFGDSDAAVLEHLRRHAAGDVARMLEGQSEIRDFEYDWQLNDAQPPRG